MKSIDGLVRNLLKYARRPEWKPRFDEVWHEHLGQAADHLGMATDALADLVEQEGWRDHLFGPVFEDFATRRLADGASFARVYLKRAGWREAPRGRFVSFDSSIIASHARQLMRKSCVMAFGCREIFSIARFTLKSSRLGD